MQGYHKELGSYLQKGVLLNSGRSWIPVVSRPWCCYQVSGGLQADALKTGTEDY